MSRVVIAAVITTAALGCGGTPERVPRFDISVRKDHAGHVGVGHATLLGEAAKTERDSSPHRRLAAARAWLALAEELEELEELEALEALAQFADAYAAALNGIAELGDEYRTRTLKDDTSLALKIAEREAADGAHDTAARGAITVLDERVQLYARKFRGIAE